MTTSQRFPELPTGTIARQTVEYVRSRESEAVANHSIRSYLFATLIADHEGLKAEIDFDPDLLFYACLMHDLGTSASAPGRQRFEVEGADMAAELLSGYGYGMDDVDPVWEAIALHTAPGIAERRGPLAYLTRSGVGADFGLGVDLVTDAQAEAIHLAHPRLNVATALVDDIIRTAERSPQAAARFTVARELIRERGDDGAPTTMELAMASSRWGA